MNIRTAFNHANKQLTKFTTNLQKRLAFWRDPEDSEDEKAWQAREQERLTHWKKEHFWLWLLEQLEPYLMTVGFVCFFLQPFYAKIDPTLGALARGFSGYAMGLGFASWLGNKSLRRLNFSIMRWTEHFFEGLKKALDEGVELAKKQQIDELMKTEVKSNSKDKLPN